MIHCTDSRFDCHNNCHNILYQNVLILTYLQVITFIDLAGHEKYLKTTVFGMTGHAPDFAMLMVSTLYCYDDLMFINWFV